MKSFKFAVIIIMIMIFLPFTAGKLGAQDKALEKIIAEERKEEKERKRVIVGENSWLEVHLLLQAQAYTQNTYDKKAGETVSDETWPYGFQLKRARLMFSGEAAKNVEFFVETDDINIGNQGPAANNSTQTEYTDSSGNNSVKVKDQKGSYIQDAYINYKIADELEVSIGMMLLPFMHENRQSAVSLLGVDYNSVVVPLTGTSNVWRDTGVEIRGLLFETAGNKKGLFDYRLGVWRGFADRNMKGNPDKNDDINPEAAPRFCGRIQLNIV
ncbi:MAG: porin, partial [Spirochaetes bacterium]|nr:porin [Spirochaetota bacterium]